jgi:hypothetical protein
VKEITALRKIRYINRRRGRFCPRMFGTRRIWRQAKNKLAPRTWWDNFQRWYLVLTKKVITREKMAISKAIRPKY